MFPRSSLAFLFVASAVAQFIKGNGSLPLLKLPYATYQASKYDKANDFYTFENIRFAAPPVGDLRWAKPAPPEPVEGVQVSSGKISCYQAIPKFISDLVIIGDPYELLTKGETMQEDCLFLDLRIPGKALMSAENSLPVMVWFHGGGYTLGSKGFSAYDPTPLMKSAQGDMIQISINYRLGAFGYLNGDAVKAHGTSNVGFYDQRAALQWVQKYISLARGDSQAVTVMGESAGAGSILNHIIAGGGKGELSPLFQRAIVQSPPYSPNLRPENDFNAFSDALGCGNVTDLTCFRSKTAEELQEANKKVVYNSPVGGFNFGPTVDGEFIKDFPARELANGNFWKDLTLIASHNPQEGLIFTPWISTAEEYDAEINRILPRLTPELRKNLDRAYPPPEAMSAPYMSHFSRLAALIGDRIFNCNVRFLAKAFAGKLYAYNFDILPWTHGVDLLYTFYVHPNMTDIVGPEIIQLLGAFNITLDISSSLNFAEAYQSYLTSFIRTGSPNTFRKKTGQPVAIEMPFAKVAGTISEMIHLNMDMFYPQDDVNAMQLQCDFWEGLDYSAVG